MSVIPKESIHRALGITLVKPKKPRCLFLYGIAPQGFSPADANTAINSLIGRKDIPLCLYHDHFIGQPGGIAIFDVRDLAKINALEIAVTETLQDWRVEIRPLIFSHNPAAFDEQIAYTLQAYGNVDWAEIKRENRPVYVDPGAEAETASDD